MSDRDKGIAKAMLVTFTGRDVPRQFFCAHHCEANLAWFGKETNEVFDKLLNAKTVEQIAIVKNSVDFKGLRDSARDAMTSVDDSMQFLAACVAESGKTYGRTKSQAVESTNGHIMKARSVHLLISILRICEYDKERFDRFAAQSAACTMHLPPASRSQFQALRSNGTVTDCPGRSSPTDKEFIAQTARDRRHEVTLHFVLVDAEPENGSGGATLSFGTFSCGVPARNHFPCGHMYTVYLACNLDERKLVPQELTAAASSKQYLSGLEFVVASMTELLLDDNLCDVTLGLTVIAPPKCERPRTKRLRHAMEVSSRTNRSLRRNATR